MKILKLKNIGFFIALERLFTQTFIKIKIVIVIFVNLFVLILRVNFLIQLFYEKMFTEKLQILGN